MKIIFLTLLFIYSITPCSAVELLVYNKAHWMDSLTQVDINKQIAKSPDFMAEYNSRYQRGDIIEVRLDGYWTDGTRSGFGKEHFALIMIPGVSLESAKKYTKVLESAPDVNGDTTVIKRRKFQVDMTKITLGVDKKASVVGILNAHIKEKTN